MHRIQRSWPALSPAQLRRNRTPYRHFHHCFGIFLRLGDRQHERFRIIIKILSPLSLGRTRVRIVCWQTLISWVVMYLSHRNENFEFSKSHDLLELMMYSRFVLQICSLHATTRPCDPGVRLPERGVYLRLRSATRFLGIIERASNHRNPVAFVVAPLSTCFHSLMR